MFFSCDPPDSFVQFYPPRTVFPANFIPIVFFFANFTPSDSFFRHFNPLGQFILTILTPSDNFSWDPLRTKFAFFYHQDKNKDFSYPPGQGDLTPLDKKAISSPPSRLVNGIALRAIPLKSLEGGPNFCLFSTPSTTFFMTPSETNYNFQMLNPFNNLLLSGHLYKYFLV